MEFVNDYENYVNNFRVILKCLLYLATASRGSGAVVTSSLTSGSITAIALPVHQHQQHQQQQQQQHQHQQQQQHQLLQQQQQQPSPPQTQQQQQLQPPKENQQHQQQAHVQQQQHKIKAQVASIPLGGGGHGTGAGGEEEEIEDKPKFILAPTPAQLGKAPRQKRLSTGPMSAIADTPPQLSPDTMMAPPQHPCGETKVSPGRSTPSEGDASNQQTPVPPSPSEKKSFFKKNIEDGMDKVLEEVNFEQKFGALPEFNPDEVQSPSVNASVPSSPRTFISSYRKKRKHSTGGEESEAETPLSVTPHMTPSRTPSSTLQGSKFFPPDFNPESFKVGDVRAEKTEMDSPAGGRSPRTPKTPRDSDKSHSSLRHILEQRRTLVMQLFTEYGWFPPGKPRDNINIVHSCLLFAFYIHDGSGPSYLRNGFTHLNNCT
ncbi:putative transcription factor capicua [Chionoecetes opilio]|uniref:Putative transcription factor capicua n=1 Tax=Chionoecetes opilio TaxID=41210 RepID=A0A8J5CFK2_CHIOP|nr:putative transcription factor capicua [Chionoecetes opilio]